MIPITTILYPPSPSVCTAVSKNYYTPMYTPATTASILPAFPNSISVPLDIVQNIPETPSTKTTKAKKSKAVLWPLSAGYIYNNVIRELMYPRAPISPSGYFNNNVSSHYVNGGVARSDNFAPPVVFVGRQQDKLVDLEEYVKHYFNKYTRSLKKEELNGLPAVRCVVDFRPETFPQSFSLHNGISTQLTNIEVVFVLLLHLC